MGFQLENIIFTIYTNFWGTEFKFVIRNMLRNILEIIICSITLFKEGVTTLLLL